MKFKFTCELCKKEVKRGDHFNLDIFKKETEHEGHGHECVDSMCKKCADRITSKIESMRK